jgi:RCC1 and BTB domain-containing protein
LLSDLKIIRIERGAHHTLALTQTRDVYSWGMNEDGQVGVEREKDWQLIPIKIEGFVDQKILQISCGYYHSMSLTESGHVFNWGNNEFGKLGLGNEKDTFTPKIIKLDNVRISKICCGPFHSLVLSNDREIYAFGANDYGQIGTNKEKQIKPAKLFHQNVFVDIMSHWNENPTLELYYFRIFYSFFNTITPNMINAIL